MASTLLKNSFKLPKAAKGAFLAAGIAFAGSAVFSAGSAQAFTLSNGFAITELTPPIGSVSFIDAPGEAAAAVIFSPAASGSGSFSYKITAPKGLFFKSVNLDSDKLLGGTSTVTKLVEWGTSSTSLESFNGSEVSFSFLGKPTYLTITDSFVTTGTAKLSAFSNSFVAVPGPLPVLGVFAALGYSRKLRQRVNQAKLSSPSV